jgi:GT2 family glycosyltransferase
MIKTAIVILNWNGVEYLNKFLGTVVKYSSTPDTVVFVADNGSTDDSVSFTEENFSSIKLIKLEKNHGFAGGYNLALRQLDARYFVLINSDVEVTEGWLEPLVNYMDNNPDVAACQPKILSYDRKEYFEHAGAAGGFIDKYGYPFCRGRIMNVTEKDKGQYDSDTDIFWSSGACMMVRAEAWNQCEGFDKDFFAHMEEIDLCWRFNKAGYRVSFIYGSKVYHIGGGSLSYDSPQKIFLNFRNSLFMLYRNLPDGRLRSVMFIRRVLDGIAGVMFLFKGRPGYAAAVWRAHMNYYKSLPELRAKRGLSEKTAEAMPGKLVLNKSIVFEFYIKGNKTYDRLINGKTD